MMSLGSCDVRTSGYGSEAQQDAGRRSTVQDETANTYVIEVAL